MAKAKKPALVADLFCGAGGSSQGARRALERKGVRMQLVAVNHWPLAIETHSKNHPDARHYCVDISAAKPQDLVPEGYLDLLMASPSCTHHSRARGGRPMEDQSRESAWGILRWADTLYIRRILIENVPEFLEWGPLGANGRPLKSKKGECFRQFVSSIEGYGYKVEWRVLNAADYGDATTRKRLFIMARRDRKPIVWPEPTHSPNGNPSLFGGDLQRWRSAREIIDWTIPGKSIFDRKKPLAPNTIRRIATGLKKFGGPAAEPFLAMLYGTGTARSIDEPLPTVTAGGNHIALVEPAIQPFIVPQFGEREGQEPRSHSVNDPLPTITSHGAGALVEPRIEPFVCANRTNNVPRGLDQPVPTIQPFTLGQQSCSIARDVKEPLPTIATSGAISLIEPTINPFVLGQQTNSAARSVDEPIPTVCTGGKIAVIEPVLVNMKGQSDCTSIDRPAPTVTAHARHLAIAEAFIISPRHSEGGGPAPRSVESPLPTITAGGSQVAIVEPFLTKVNHGDGGGSCNRRVQALDEPIGGITTRCGTAIVSPFLTPYYGSSGAVSAGEPLDTVTTKARFGLVEPVVAGGDGGQGGRIVEIDGFQYVLDIRFRMLKNHELAAAMGFNDEEMKYEFVGNAGQITKQIGNAVPVNLSSALVSAFFSDEGTPG